MYVIECVRNTLSHNSQIFWSCSRKTLPLTPVNSLYASLTLNNGPHKRASWERERQTETRRRDGSREKQSNELWWMETERTSLWVDWVKRLRWGFSDPNWTDDLVRTLMSRFDIHWHHKPTVTACDVKHLMNVKPHGDEYKMWECGCLKKTKNKTKQKNRGSMISGTQSVVLREMLCRSFILVIYRKQSSSESRHDGKEMGGLRWN